FVPAAWLVMNVNPLYVPPLTVTPGYCGDPSRLLRNDSESALAADMMNVTPSTAMLFVAKCEINPMMSAMGFVVAAAVGAPFVILAGLTPATAATAGSMNCASRNCAIPAIMSLRTRSSALGSESMISSLVSTMIPAALATPSEVEANASFVTGLGFASPTHPYVPPAL